MSTLQKLIEAADAIIADYKTYTCCPAPTIVRLSVALDAYKLEQASEQYHLDNLKAADQYIEVEQSATAALESMLTDAGGKIVDCTPKIGKPRAIGTAKKGKG